MTQATNQKDSQGRRHGVWADYWSSGTPEWKVSWDHGVLHGIWESFYSWGQISHRKKYDKGVLKGIEIYFFGSGKTRKKIYHLPLK
jgi:antitoxin component YwqK of YwqJK toxin-antitoxin module